MVHPFPDLPSTGDDIQQHIGRREGWAKVDCLFCDGEAAGRRVVAERARQYICPTCRGTRRAIDLRWTYSTRS